MSKSKGNTLDPIDLIDGISLEALLAKSTLGLLRGEHKAKVEKYVRAHYPAGILPLAPTPCVSPSLRWRASRTQSISARCGGLPQLRQQANATRFAADDTEARMRAGRKGPGRTGLPGPWIVSALQRTLGQVELGFRRVPVRQCR